MLGLQEDKQKGVIYTQIETEFELSSILNLWFSDPGQGIDILIVVELGKNPLNTTVMIDRERIDEDAEEV